MSLEKLKSKLRFTLASLPLALAATHASAELHFTELPITLGSDLTFFNLLDVSNNGVVAISADDSFIKWSSSTGVVNLGSNDGSSYEPQISNDGEVIAFTIGGIAYHGKDQYVFDGNNTLTFNRYDNMALFTLSPDGKQLGGQNNNSIAATYQLSDSSMNTYIPHILHSFNHDSSQALINTSQSLLHSSISLLDSSTGQVTEIFADLPQVSLLPWHPGLTDNGQYIVAEGWNATCENGPLCPLILNVASGTTTEITSDIVFRPVSANADATIVLSNSSEIWDPINGARDFQEMLISKGINVAGWSNFDNLEVSPNGTNIVGTAVNENGIRRPFIVTDVPVCSSGFQ